MNERNPPTSSALTLRFRFPIPVSDSSAGVWETGGPLFHRWLPDGRKDALVCDMPDLNAKVTMWFERRGARKPTDDGFLQYSPDAPHLDEDEVSSQAILSGGNLLGEVVMQLASTEAIMAMLHECREDPEYVALGKRALKAVQGGINAFLKLMRYRYGQYWVQLSERWDSRKCSLGQCCRRHHMEFRNREGTWQLFLPTAQRVSLHGSAPSDQIYREFIDASDWQQIGREIDPDYEPCPAAVSLVRALEQMYAGELALAFVFGALAAEQALSQRVRALTKGKQHLAETLQQFHRQGGSLDYKLSLIALTDGVVRTDEVEDSVKALEVRNKIVHEGYSPDESDLSKLRHLLSAVATLCDNMPQKMPDGNLGHNTRWVSANHTVSGPHLLMS